MDSFGLGRSFKVDVFEYMANDDKQRHTDRATTGVLIPNTQDPYSNTSDTRSDRTGGMRLTSLDAQFAAMFPDVNNQSGAVSQNAYSCLNDGRSALVGSNNTRPSAYGRVRHAPIDLGQVADSDHGSWKNSPPPSEARAFERLPVASRFNTPRHPVVSNAPSLLYPRGIPAPPYPARRYVDTLPSNTYTQSSASQLPLLGLTPYHNAATSVMPAYSHNTESQPYGPSRPASYVEGNKAGYGTGSEAEFWLSQVDNKPILPVESYPDLAGTSITTGVQAYQTQGTLKPDGPYGSDVGLPVYPDPLMSLEHGLGEVHTPHSCVDTGALIKHGPDEVQVVQTGNRASHDIPSSKARHEHFTPLPKSAQCTVRPHDPPFEVTLSDVGAADPSSDQPELSFDEAYPPAIVNSINDIRRTGVKLHESLERCLAVRRAHDQLLGEGFESGLSDMEFANGAVNRWFCTPFPSEKTNLGPRVDELSTEEFIKYQVSKAANEESKRTETTRLYRNAIISDDLAAVHGVLEQRYGNMGMFKTKGKTLGAFLETLEKIKLTDTSMSGRSKVVAARKYLRERCRVLENLQKDCSRVGLKQVQADLEAFREAVKSCAAPTGMLLGDPHAFRKTASTSAHKGTHSNLDETASTSVRRKGRKTQKGSKHPADTHSKNGTSRRRRR